MVGNSHAMGVAAQIIEDLFGTAEGWFGVNDPFGFLQWCKVLGESLGITESLQGGKKLQLALVEGGLQVFEE